ncbi:MAG: hypothetical protein IH790_01300, partial [Acidobacteria bacterium]|nr:hypothetical protein [Acidobacteriota bacterium]
QVTVISYSDKDIFLPDVPWTLSWPGNDDGDSLLENNEKAEITVWILNRDFAVTSVGSADSATVMSSRGITSAGDAPQVNDEFTLEVNYTRSEEFPGGYVHVFAFRSSTEGSYFF